MTAEIIADYACETAECPLWHAAEQRLYWTDIPTGRLFRYDPAANRHQQVYQGRPVGGFTVQADGTLLLFRDRCNVAVWHVDDRQSTLVEQLPDETDTRFNDVIADPQGRVFCGTLAVKRPDGTVQKPGRLYRLDLDGSIRPVFQCVGTANGMGFSPDGRTFYFTDTGAGTIWQFAYNCDTGEISAASVFAQVPDLPGEGRPDGLTVDTQGNVWSARWDGGAVVCYDPRGRLLRRIELPARNVSSLALAGPDYSHMYVTTAGAADRAANGPLAGMLLRLDAPTPGVPEFCSRIGL